MPNTKLCGKPNYKNRASDEITWTNPLSNETLDRYFSNVSTNVTVMRYSFFHLDTWFRNISILVFGYFQNVSR